MSTTGKLVMGDIVLEWDEEGNEITITKTEDSLFGQPEIGVNYDQARTLFRALAFLFKPFDPRDYPEVR